MAKTSSLLSRSSNLIKDSSYIQMCYLKDFVVSFSLDFFEEAAVTGVSASPTVICIIANRELKQGTFSGLRRPDRQREVGTDVTAASCQNKCLSGEFIQ